jgi:uncharacterized protein YqeY
MSEPTISERIQAEMVRAMKEKDAETLSTVRMLKAALMEAKTSKPKDVGLTREEEIEVLQRYVKKRRETIEINTKAARTDLNPSEEREIAVTQRFLPAMLSEDELAAIVKAAVASTGAAGPRDMGKVIGAVMAQVTDGQQSSSFPRAPGAPLPRERDSIASHSRRPSPWNTCSVRSTRPFRSTLTSATGIGVSSELTRSIQRCPAGQVRVKWNTPGRASSTSGRSTVRLPSSPNSARTASETEAGFEQWKVRTV